MPINDLPKSLIDSVVEVVTQSAENHNKMWEKIVLEGLKKFGASSLSELSEGDQKALHAWAQLRLSEATCACGHDMEEDDLPNDAVFHKDGEEDSEKKKELDENSVTAAIKETALGLYATGVIDGKTLAEFGVSPSGLRENVALGSDELATNGAVGVGDALVALPKHADVIHDTDPYTNTTQYRLLLQYATNEGTRIYPPVGLPGAMSVADLRTLVEGLPEFNEAIDSALVNASSSAAVQSSDE